MTVPVSRERAGARPQPLLKLAVARVVPLLAFELSSLGQARATGTRDPTLLRVRVMRLVRNEFVNKVQSLLFFLASMFSLLLRCFYWGKFLLFA